jgi:hypothetical protein
MNLKEIVLDDVDWIHMIRDRAQLWAVVNTIINLRVPFKWWERRKIYAY